MTNFTHDHQADTEAANMYFALCDLLCGGPKLGPLYPRDMVDWAEQQGLISASEARFVHEWMDYWEDI